MPSLDRGKKSVASPAAETLLRRLQASTRGEFEIIRQIGHGGMARVYVAREVALRRHVALKVLSPFFSEYPHVVRRFQHEARTSARLSHPNIVSVLAVYERDGLSFFSMPYVAGSSLRQILRSAAALGIDEALGYLQQAAAGLAYAHERGVVHRDVKPENMLLEHPHRRLVLTDFGLAKALGGESLTLPGDLIGTPRYMAPEQAEAKGGIDARSDQYSLALVLYEMLAGRYPFESDGLRELIIKQVTEDPPPLAERRPDVPAEVCRAIERALSKDPADRFPSIDEFAHAVTGSEAPVSARPDGREEPEPDRPADDDHHRELEQVVAVDLDSTFGAETLWMRDRLVTMHRRRRVATWLGRGATLGTASIALYMIGAAISVTGPSRTSEGAIDSTKRGLAAGGPATGGPGELRSDEVDPRGGGELFGAPPQPGVEPDRNASRRDIGAGTESGRSGAEKGTVDPGAGTADPGAKRLRDGKLDSSSRAAIQGLIERYRLGLESEDLNALRSKVYKGEIPGDNAKMLKDVIFANAENLQVELYPREFKLDGKRVIVEVEHRMDYVLARTKRPLSTKLTFEMSFAPGPSGWRLIGLKER